MDHTLLSACDSREISKEFLNLLYICLMFFGTVMPIYLLFSDQTVIDTTEM